MPDFDVCVVMVYLLGIVTQVGPNAVEQQIIAIAEIEIQRLGVDFSRRFEELFVRGLVHFNHRQTFQVFDRL